MGKIEITDDYKKQDKFRKEFISLLEKYKIEIEDFYVDDPVLKKNMGSNIHFQGKDIDISLNDLLMFYLKRK